MHALAALPRHHMSKCAQNMMGKLLSLDLKERGIPIVCLHPGFMKTKMTEVYKDHYDELGAVGPEESAPGIVEVCRLHRLSVYPVV